MTIRERSSIQQELRDGPPRARRERAALWVPVLRADVRALRQRIEQVTRDYHSALELRTGLEATSSDFPHVDPEDRRKAFWARLGGSAILAIETVLAIGLSIWSLTLWPVVAGAIGALVALGWTAGSLGVHYGCAETDRPLRALQAGKRGTWLSFVIALIALVPLLLARAVAPAAALTGLATTVISLGFSSLSAHLFLVAFLATWAGPSTKEFQGLQVEIALTEQLEQEAIAIAEGRFPLRPGSVAATTKEDEPQ